MQHSNVSIFVPHIGCPNKCSFCNQNSITGQCLPPTTSYVKDACRTAYASVRSRQDTEIAFFGGSFTAIDKKYMLDLLECVQEYIGEGKFKGIRISTRPDCIDETILKLLKKYNVTAIELGAQSMDDTVLSENDRGHTANDVIIASEMIKSYGFELGLQMMVSLYKSTPELDMITAQKLLALKPDTIRIYPVVILENTRLGDLYKSGVYKPYDMKTAIGICAKLITLFEDNNIKIIKLGLHASELVEEQMLGGLYHPAFKELCENRIFLDKILNLLNSTDKKTFTVYVSPSAISKAIGQKRCNITELKKRGYKVTVKSLDTLNKYDVLINEEETACI